MWLEKMVGRDGQGMIVSKAINRKYSLWRCSYIQQREWPYERLQLIGIILGVLFILSILLGHQLNEYLVR